ncbi:hypothetical protein D3C72_2289740 [compost metagenome]
MVLTRLIAGEKRVMRGVQGGGCFPAFMWVAGFLPTAESPSWLARRCALAGRVGCAGDAVNTSL